MASPSYGIKAVVGQGGGNNEDKRKRMEEEEEEQEWGKVTRIAFFPGAGHHVKRVHLALPIAR